MTQSIETHKLYQLEEHINDWVKLKFDKLKLKNQVDYYTESAIPDYLKEALRGTANPLAHIYR